MVSIIAIIYIVFISLGLPDSVFGVAWPVVHLDFGVPESFAEFADTLQKEIEQETGVKFGVLQISMFTGMAYEETKQVEKTVSAEQAVQVVEVLKTSGIVDESGNVKADIRSVEIELPKELEEVKAIVATVVDTVIEKSEPVRAEQIVGTTYTATVTKEKTVSYEEAADLMEHFEKKDYITKSGKIKDTMKNALLTGTLDLPKKYEAVKERFEEIVRNADRKPPIRDASRDVVVKLKKQVIDDPRFTAIWEKIRQKTTYRVQIDNEELVRQAVKGLKDMPKLPKARLVSGTADIDIQNVGVTHRETHLKTTDIANDYTKLPDILAVIREETHTPKPLAVRILQESGRIGDFFANPQLFIENCVDIIQQARHELAIDGIRYVKLDGEKYYALEIFDSRELMANLDKNAVAVNNSVYDHIVYDSAGVEKPFALALDSDPQVKMFFKLPERFKIQTPIGTYNPDWAVYLEKDGEEKLYFVLETKGSTDRFDLRTAEQLKIHCGKQHFKALDNGVELEVATNWRDFKVRR